jgi:TPR repeat protein
VLRRLGPALAVALILGLTAPNNSQADAGREAFERGDYATAYSIWKPVAEQGVAAAQHNLGVLYRHGFGVEKDFALALKWFGRAAAQGDADAQFALGELYSEGVLAPEDYRKAAEWYRRAAEQGHIEAQRGLGFLYADGRGVPQDYSEAAKWFLRAAEQGDGVAQDWLDDTLAQARRQAIPGFDDMVSPTPERTKPNRKSERAECPGKQGIPYHADVSIDIPPATLHHTLSIAELGELSFHGPRKRVLGLAKIDLQLGWNVEFAAKPCGDRYCLWVKRADLALRYKTHDIYVAREYDPDTCAYQVVLEHEKEHVRVTRAILENYGPTLESLLTSPLVPTGARPTVVDRPGEVEAEVRALMAELVHPVYEEMIARLGEAQAKLDSPEEYRRTFQLCRNW